MKYIIYSPARRVSQSGKAKEGRWVLRARSDVVSKSLFIDDVMDYTAIRGFANQIDLNFNTLEQAVEYATANNLQFNVVLPQKAVFRKKTYASNFD